MRVAALYVETDGAYFGFEDVDPWDAERDARLYAGPHPVVAHPPCNKWSPLAHINQKRLPDYCVGDDGGCFAAALAAVNEFGGVLEHPARSLAWKHHGLPKPARLGYGWISCRLAGDGTEREGRWVCEVAQSAYGHRARKLTWLYCVSEETPAPLDWSNPPRDVIVSGFTHQPKGAHVACEHRRVRPKEASQTPAAFRDALLALASGVVCRPTEGET